jgi:hypothetical protein
MTTPRTYSTSPAAISMRRLHARRRKEGKCLRCEGRRWKQLQHCRRHHEQLREWRYAWQQRQRATWETPDGTAETPSRT